MSGRIATATMLDARGGLGATSGPPLALSARAESTWMPRLIERELAAIGKLESGHQPPAGVVDRSRELDPLGVELCHRCVQVVCNEIQLITGFTISRVDGKLGRQRAEDRPSAPSVDR